MGHPHYTPDSSARDDGPADDPWPLHDPPPSSSPSGSGSSSHPQRGASPSGASGRNDPSARGYAVSATLIPTDPDRALVECECCSYTRTGDTARVDVDVHSFPDRAGSRVVPDWEIVVADGDGQVLFGGVIEGVRRRLKSATYTVRIERPDDSSPTCSTRP
jgi:hypothetical protein